MFHQDWKPVVFKKPKPIVQLQSKTQNSQINYNNSIKKLEADLDHTLTDNIPSIPLNTLTPDQRKELIQYRIAKNLTQAQLAKSINEQTSIINNLENGKVVNVPNILIKINKILGTKLKFIKN
jgi:ribosome-binding protein aMBF1 (putative translation factor)